MEIEKKNGKGIIALVVFLILIILGLISYICYDKFYLNSNSKNDNEENKVDVNANIKEDISIDSQIVTDAMETFKKIYISDSSLYANNNYNVSEISNYDLVATALINIDPSYIVSNCVDEPKKTVSFEILNSALNKYILNQTITENIIKSLKKESSYPAAQYEVADTGINLKEDGLELYGSCGGIYGFNDYVNKKVVSAEKDNDYLYIYEKQAFAKYSVVEIDSNILVNYYKDYNKTTLLEKDLDSIHFTDENGNVGKNSTPNWDLYNTYKYTFKIVDNNYYFQSFELANK